MDTIKSLAVISMLGAVLYGVYVVASKPEKPLSPEMAAMTQLEGPVIEPGGSSLSPPSFEMRTEFAATKVGASTKKETNPSSVNTLDTTTEKQSKIDNENTKSDDGGKVYNEDKSTFQRVNNVAPQGPDSDTLADPGEGVRVGSAASSVSDAEIEAQKARVRRYAFTQAWELAREQVKEDRYREALLALSAFYNDPVLNEQEREELIGWLDALAAKVIYSTEHIMEPAYEVRHTETLYQVANKYNVPYLLLKNINSVRNVDVLTPGTKLKVLRGPFHAEVDRTRQEITLYVQNLYAGRFPCSLGNESAPPGEYTIKEKTADKEFRTPQGVIPPKDPRNPYGGIYLELDTGVSIHGSPAEAYADAHSGCIALAPRDAEDLFSILSVKESKITVRD